MYRHCIFCSGELGRNESVEEFPIGERLAFDAAKGRLWAVCGRCRRWNLAPIEERWEAVESAEKRFRGSRLRVHSENIGLARLPEGGVLIRVGEALPNEFAAWRYGDELMKRRRAALIWGGVAAVGGAAAFGAGIVLSMVIVAAYLPLYAVGAGRVFNALSLARHQGRVVGRRESAGAGRLLKMRDMFGARVVAGTRGTVALEVPDPAPHLRIEEGPVVRWVPPPPYRIEGEEAARVLSRVMIHANRTGASPSQLGAALERLGPGGRNAEFLDRLGARSGALFSMHDTPNTMSPQHLSNAWSRFVGTFRGERIAGRPLLASRPLPSEDRLALEIALHENSERRALEGELAAYRDAWREAEEIASIADVLPDDPLDRLPR